MAKSKKTQKADTFLNSVGELQAMRDKSAAEIKAFERAKILPAFVAVGCVEGAAVPDDVRKGEAFKELRDRFKRGAVMHYARNVNAGEAFEGRTITPVDAYAIGKRDAAYKALSAGERAVYDRVASVTNIYADTAFSRFLSDMFPRPATSGAATPSKGKASKGKGKGGKGKAAQGEAVPATPENVAQVMTWAQLAEAVAHKAANDQPGAAANGLASLIKVAQGAVKRVAERAKVAA